MQQHGGDQVAATLQALGVQQLYTLCGGHISPILSGCKALGIQIVDVRDEASAVFAADATARLTGIPGVAAVTAGPGVTNTVTAVKNAQLAQSPVVILGGASATLLRGRGALQDIDQMALMKPHVKLAVSVTQVRDIPAVLRNAFVAASEGVPGPVFVELPIDLLYPQTLVREWYGIKGGEQASGKLVKRALQWYLGRHADQVFRPAASHAFNRTLDELTTQFESGVESAQMLLGEAALQGMARLAGSALRRAKRPLVLLGSQAVQNPLQLTAVRDALEQLGLPVYLSGMARGLLGADHPLQYRHQRKQALREADWVLLAGVPCDFRLDYGNHINAQAHLVAVNRSRQDLLRNRVPALPVWGDAASFLQALAKSQPKSPKNRAKSTAADQTAWADQLTARETAREAEIDAMASQPTQRINPLALMRAINRQLDTRSVIVADGGDFVATAAYTLQPRGPLRWLDPGVFGTLGVGGGFALGAAMTNPEAEVWIIYGDGSSAYSLAEIDTFVRMGRGMIAVIGNDACWNQIARDQVTLLGDDVGVMLRHTDYHRVAQGYGGEGLLLDDPARMDAVLAQAKALAAQGRPVVINVILEPSDFRKGSISV